MRKLDRDGRPKRPVSMRAGAGLVAVLAVAALCAYFIAGGNPTVKPASGSAHAMGLASSTPQPD